MFQTQLTFTRIRKIAYALRSRAGRNALLRGVVGSYEHHTALAKYEFRTVLDVGANRGQFAIFCRDTFPDAHVVSFEPLQYAAQKFRDLFRDDCKVTLHEFAVGDEICDSLIHVTADDDGSSLLHVHNNQTESFGTVEVSSQDVHVVPLNEIASCDVILIEPTLLKIDVQGFELNVLKGATRLLPRIECIYVECSYCELYSAQPLVSDVIRFLDAHQFRLQGVFNQTGGKAGVPVQADFLFKRSTL